MSKLTQTELFKMFEPFGITSERVVDTLEACGSKEEAAQAFEGLKSLATIRYEEMRSGEVSTQRFQEVKPTHERLMRICLKNYTPKKKKPLTEDEENEKVLGSKSVRKLAEVGNLLKNGNVAGLMDLLDPDADKDGEREALEIIMRRIQDGVNKK